MILLIANEKTRILLTQDRFWGVGISFEKLHLGIILIRLGTNIATEKARLVNFVMMEYG
jgi:hypothetical protein